EERVETAELCPHRHPEHRTKGLRCDDTRKMCGSARSCDEHLYAPRLDVRDVCVKSVGCPMGGEDSDLVLDPELPQRLDRVLHRLPVGARAHHHGDLQTHRAVAFFLSAAWTARAVLRKSASAS